MRTSSPVWSSPSLSTVSKWEVLLRFRKLREALKKQRYRVQSDDVALPEVYTGQVAHSDAPETPEKHKSINYENVAIPEVHVPKKKP